MSKTLSKPAEQAWIALMRTPIALLELVQEDLKRHGFPPLEWYDVLLELGRDPGGRVRQRDLGKRLMVPAYNLSRLLDRMEAGGLIARQASRGDGRGADVVMTSEGLALRERMWPAYATAVKARIQDRLGEDDLKALADILGRIQPST